MKVRLTSIGPTMVMLFALLMIAFPAPGLAAAETTSPDRVQTRDEIISTLKADYAIYPLKPPNTSSPRATLKSFLENMNNAHRLVMAAHRKNMAEPGMFSSESVMQTGKVARELFERGVWCLDLSAVPEALKTNVGYEGALKLKEILDRIQLPPFDSLPDADDIEKNIENKKVPDLLRWPLLWTDIVIAMVEEGPRKGQFLFTPATVARLDVFYTKVKALPYRKDKLVSPGFLEFYDRTPGRLLPPKWSRWLPAWSTRETFYYQTLWQWCALIALPAFAVLFIWLIHRLWRRKEKAFAPVTRSWGPVVITLIAVATAQAVLQVLADQIGISGPLLINIDAALRVVIWILLSYAALLAGRAVGRTINASRRIDPQGLHAGLLSALTSLIGFIAALIIIFYGFASLGVSVIPLLTGLGVGGLAVALAARPTLENLIGGFMILVDRPFRVGQHVRVKGYEGNIEKIGFRSTRIRLFSGFQTIIPNEEMARLDIENVDRRPYIRRRADITVPYNTPPEKVDRAVKIIEDILEGHAGMDAERPPKVYFEDFNADSLNIVVRYWCHGLDLWHFRELSHQVNLQIMRAFDKEGIEFAFPTTTNYLAQEDQKPLQVKISSE